MTSNFQNLAKSFLLLQPCAYTPSAFTCLRCYASCDQVRTQVVSPEAVEHTFSLVVFC